MLEENSLTILRCELCSKPFNKAATLKRHGYYCRSLRVKDRPARLHSCIACAKAKAKCDNGDPKCSRCVTKNIDCQRQTRQPSKRRINQSENTTTHIQSPGLPSTDQDLDSQTSLDATEQDLLLDVSLPNSQATKVGLEIFDFTEFQSSPNSLETQSTDLAEFCDILPSNPNYALTPGSITSVPAFISYDIRCFSQKLNLNVKTRTTAMLMYRMLTAYPKVMHVRGSLPPFIHPFSISYSQVEEKEWDAMSSCASLMQIAGADTSSVRKLFWKNVKLECERMYAEWPSMDEWDLLSCMEALLVYMLVRLDEGATPYNDFDFLLLSSVWVIGCAINAKIGNNPCTSPYGLQFGEIYKDWIFEESRRRLSLVFRTISMLVSTDPSGGSSACSLPDGFFLTPLAARKGLWEAISEQEWLIERRKDFGLPTSFGVKLDGSMVKLEEYRMLMDPSFMGQAGYVNDSEANWQEWCKDMDELGALVMLAVSLST